MINDLFATQPVYTVRLAETSWTATGRFGWGRRWRLERLLRSHGARRVQIFCTGPVLRRTGILVYADGVVTSQVMSAIRHSAR